MATCPNCGADVPSDKASCPNCGATIYPRPQPEKRGCRLHRLAVGRPFSRPVAIAFLIVGGSLFGFMGGCGLYVGLTGEEVVKGMGWFFAVLGLLLLGFVIWEVRRAFRNK